MGNCRSMCADAEKLAATLGIEITVPAGGGRGGGTRYGPGDWFCSVCEIMLKGWKGGSRCPCCRLWMRRRYYPDGTPTATARRVRRTTVMRAKLYRNGPAPRACADCGAAFAEQQLPAPRSRNNGWRRYCIPCAKARNKASQLASNRRRVRARKKGEAAA